VTRTDETEHSTLDEEATILDRAERAAARGMSVDTTTGSRQVSSRSTSPRPAWSRTGACARAGATALQPRRGVDPQVRAVTQPAEHQRTSANVVENDGAGSRAAAVRAVTTEGALPR